MKTVIALLILFTSTSFADGYDIIDRAEQNNKQIELEKRIDNIEQQHNFDDYSRQMQEIDKAILNQ